MRRALPDLFTMLLVGSMALGSLLPISGDWNHAFALLTKAAIALLFFLHGARLSRKAVLGDLLHWRLHLLIAAITFALFPALGLLFNAIAPDQMGSAFRIGILFLCALPSTVQSSVALTAIAKGNVSAAVCSATASNIAGVFLTPALVAILLSANSATTVSFGAIETVVLQLLVPFICGQLCYRYLSGLLGKHRRVTTLVDRSSILMVVYLAFSNAMLEGLWRSLSWPALAMLGVLDLALLLTVVGVTMTASRLLKFSKEDEVSIVFCGSTKSLASGLPMANAIFAGQGMGAIVLPVMMYHQIQLIFCATLARVFARRDSQGSPRG